MIESELFHKLTSLPLQDLYFRALRRVGRVSTRSFGPDRPLVFTLSTGRTGTATLARLLAQTRHLYALHEPRPLVYALSQKAYQYQGNADVEAVLLTALQSSRQELFERAQEAGRGYAETSPQLTFVAPLIARAMPESRFIHLVRPLDEFLISAGGRGWYRSDPDDATHRIVPKTNGALSDHWPKLDPMSKLAWFWAETNRFALDLVDHLGPDRAVTVRCEPLFAGDQECIERLFRFVGASRTPWYRVRKVLGKQYNSDAPSQLRAAMVGCSSQLDPLIQEVVNSVHLRLAEKCEAKSG